MNLYKHQFDGVEFIEKRGGSGALYFSCGLGKTAMALEVYRRQKYLEPSLKLLVICPLTLIHNAWIEDIQKFTNFKYQDLHAPFALCNILDVDIYLMNYEMLLGKEKMANILRYLRPFPITCVIDESQRMKSHNSLTTKILLKIRDYFKNRIVMSGTPAPNDETEFWSQMKFISEDVFPSSFYGFRNQYFHLQRGKQMMEIPRGSFITRDMAREMFSKGFKYSITPIKRNELMDRMKPYVIFRDINECIDLPEQIDIIRKVELTPEQAESYKSMKTELVAELKGEIVSAPFALTKLSKLRQISSGFMLTEEGKAVDFPHNAKLAELKELLEEIGEKQVIIWCWFQHEAEFISKMLGNKSRIVNGTITDNDKTNHINMFKANMIQYLIANPLSMAHGVTLTNCHYSIYYSLSYSWEQLSQSMSRIHRISQKETCFYYYLLGEGTIDEVIYKTLKRKGREEEIIKEFLA